MVGEADTDGLAPRQPDASRALHVQEKQFDRIVDPEDFPPAHRRQAAFDFRTGVIRNDFPVLHAPPQADSLEVGVAPGQIDHQEVGGNAVDWKTVTAPENAAAVQKRFVITGHQAFSPAVRVVHQPGRESGFEELPRGHGIAFADLSRRGASRNPVGRALQDIAGKQEGRQGFGQIVVVPFRQCRPVLQFIVARLQRFR